MTARRARAKAKEEADSFAALRNDNRKSEGNGYRRSRFQRE
jgi:hypothetical protein